MTTPIEILAPGGSFDALKSAIDSGADAVYFGGSRFGARTNAVNLTNEQITEAVRYAHLHGARLYVTVNTLVSDDELSDAFEFIKFCYNEGVDAVIVQDLGIVNMIKSHFPSMRIHASTQMTIHNLSGVLQAQKMGFDRVVLSRELSLKEIKYIADNSNIELEVFVHGALCMSYSGQCLFSSFLGGRSGNRGGCAQPCRLPYTLLDSNGNPISENNKYLLSLKDLCMADYISELKNIGVTSLKIEGRMKSEAYVSAVCGIYNKYRNGGEVSSDDKTLLKNIFCRGGFTDGYYKAEYGRNMLSYSSNHDNIFASATDEVVDTAKSYANSCPKLGISASFEARLGHNAVLTACYKNEKFTATSQSVVESASNAPTNKERIIAQHSKLGGTVFEYTSLEADVDDGIFFPIKEINEMRRTVVAKLEDFILKTDRVPSSDTFVNIKTKTAHADSILTASVLNINQAKAAYDIGFERIYIPYGVYIKNKDYFDCDKDIFVVKLPAVMHDGKADNSIDYTKIHTDSVCIQNFGQMNLADRFKIHADYRLNVFNSLSIKELKNSGINSCTLSTELTSAQMREISKLIPAEIVVYGRVSLMTVRNCLVKSSKGKCGCSEDEIYYLKDRKNICFPVFTDKYSCTNIIYNSTPIVMSDKSYEINSIGASMHRFDFTVETPEEMYSVVKMYDSKRKPDGSFTRGHFFNGVQ